MMPVDGPLATIIVAIIGVAGTVIGSVLTERNQQKKAEAPNGNRLQSLFVSGQMSSWKPATSPLQRCGARLRSSETSWRCGEVGTLSP